MTKIVRFRSLVTGLLLLFSAFVTVLPAQPLSLETIFLDRTYAARYGPQIFFPEAGDHFYVYRDKAIVACTKKGELREVILEQDKFSRLTGRGFDDYRPLHGGYFLVGAGTESIYRHSSRGYHYLYDSRKDTLYFLSIPGKTQSPTFSPDGKKVAFVCDNDLYVMDLQNGGVNNITNENSNRAVINGHGSWVYEEEFDLTDAMVWTADSRFLAWLRFDQEEVPIHTLLFDDGEVHEYHYPRPGDPVAAVSLEVLDIDSGKRQTFLPEPGMAYMPRLYAFSDAGKIFTIQLNRKQNHLALVAHHLDTGSSETWYREEDTLYLELPLYVNVDSERRTAITSWQDGYTRLYLSDPNRTHWQGISPEYEDVTDVYGADSLGRWYYQRTTDNGIRRVICRSDPRFMGDEALFSGGYIEASFSPDFSTAWVWRSGIHEAVVSFIAEVESGKVRYEISHSAALENWLSANTNRPEFITIQGNGYSLNAWILWPENSKRCKKHPVLFTVYGGPGYQQVLDRWPGDDMLWYHYLAQQGFVVVALDGRGTPGRGADFSKSIYGSMGVTDVEDLLLASSYMKKMRGIAKKRMGIFGWSYGGYLAVMSLLQYKSPFRAAAAVAPVTDWRLYDNVYTERYLGMPDKQEQTYRRASAIDRAGRFRGKLLIAHGSADDNVHAEHSLLLQDALTRCNKHPEFLLYHGENHSLSGEGVTFDLFSQITSFLLRHLR